MRQREIPRSLEIVKIKHSIWIVDAESAKPFHFQWNHSTIDHHLQRAKKERNKINPTRYRTHFPIACSLVFSTFLLLSLLFVVFVSHVHAPSSISFGLCMSHILIHSAMCYAVYCACAYISRHVCVNMISITTFRPIHRYIVLMSATDDRMRNTLAAIACMNEHTHLHAIDKTMRTNDQNWKWNANTATLRNKNKQFAWIVLLNVAVSCRVCMCSVRKYANHVYRMQCQDETRSVYTPTETQIHAKTNNDGNKRTDSWRNSRTGEKFTHSDWFRTNSNTSWIWEAVRILIHLTWMIIGIIVLIKDRHEYKQHKTVHKLIWTHWTHRLEQTGMVRETNKNPKCII